MTGSLDRYYVFYQVARCKNITQAAAALYSSQPNVTHTVKELERQQQQAPQSHLTGPDGDTAHAQLGLQFQLLLRPVQMLHGGNHMGIE